MLVEPRRSSDALFTLVVCVVGVECNVFVIADNLSLSLGISNTVLLSSSSIVVFGVSVKC